MAEKPISLENPSASSPNMCINGYQKAVLVIFTIFTLIFIGYYFFLLPYHDDSDLDDLFSLSAKNPFDDEYQIVTGEDDDEEGGADEYFDLDFIETTAKSESEELNFDYSDSQEGSGSDEDGPKIPSCSKSFKIPEYDKIICLIQSPKTPEDAANYCKYIRMRLLRISDDKMKQKIFDGTRKIFGVGGGTALWIDGKWNENELIWESLDDQSEVEVHPMERMLGECTRVYSPFNQKYEISSAKCALPSYFYCEKDIEE